MTERTTTEVREALASAQVTGSAFRALFWATALILAFADVDSRFLVVVLAIFAFGSLLFSTICYGATKEYEAEIERRRTLAEEIRR